MEANCTKSVLAGKVNFVGVNIDELSAAQKQAKKEGWENIILLHVTPGRFKFLSSNGQM